MKHIIKGAEPQELLKWKEENRDLDPRYKALSKIARTALVSSLLREQGYICCYCETQLSEGYMCFHVEHFRPQSFFDKNSQKFSLNSLEYQNLLCSCGDKEADGTSTNHCGDLKDKWFDDKLLISPLDPLCENKFLYTDDGEIEPSFEGDDAAKKTIEKLGLNIRKLVRSRKAVMSGFDQSLINDADLKIMFEDYLKRDSEGKFKPFWTTIDQLAKALEY